MQSFILQPSWSWPAGDSSTPGGGYWTITRAGWTLSETDRDESFSFHKYLSALLIKFRYLLAPPQKQRTCYIQHPGLLGCHHLHKPHPFPASGRLVTMMLGRLDICGACALHTFTHSPNLPCLALITTEQITSPDRGGHCSWLLTELVTIPDRGGHCSWQRCSLFLTPDRGGHSSWQRWSLFLTEVVTVPGSWQGWSLFLTPDHDDHLMTGTCAGQDHALFALSPSHTSHIHHSASVVSILEQRLLCHWTVCKLSHPSLKYTGHSLPMMGPALLAKFRRISFVGSEEVHETYLLSLNWLNLMPKEQRSRPSNVV